VKNRHKGLGKQNIRVDDEAIEHIAVMAAGDLRSAYNALELAALTTSPDHDGNVHVTLADAEQSIQRKALSYNESTYYDFLSAFCKSLRGSDANAALYYAMRLLEGGCDPMLVARRLVVHSAEDVGMADPRALQIATSAMYALEKIGYPEARIPLAQAIIYVCEAEKSNSVVEAMYAAVADARETRDDNVPPHLKDTSKASPEDKVKGREYKYPHAYGGYVEQQYLPDSLKDKIYYTPGNNGYENEVKEIRKRKGKKS
jgi:putative ATPase